MAPFSLCYQPFDFLIPAHTQAAEVHILPACCYSSPPCGMHNGAFGRRHIRWGFGCGILGSLDFWVHPLWSEGRTGIKQTFSMHIFTATESKGACALGRLLVWQLDCLRVGGRLWAPVCGTINTRPMGIISHSRSCLPKNINDVIIQPLALRWLGFCSGLIHCTLTALEQGGRTVSL